MQKAPLLTRRQLLAAAAACPLALLSGTRPARAADPPPNFLFILADDFGYADLSCYGRRDFTTPNVDRLGAEGMKFIQAYANSAVCTASRTAIITGRYQYRLPIGLEEPLGNRNVGLPATHPTVASLLKKAGYGTTLLGKWHLGRLPDFGPLQSATITFSGSAAVPSTTSLTNPACRRPTPRISGTATSKCTRTDT